MATSRLCSIPDCDKPFNAKGFCQRHYIRFLKYGDPLFTKSALAGMSKNFSRKLRANMKATSALYGLTQEPRMVMLASGITAELLSFAVQYVKRTRGLPLQIIMPRILAAGAISDV